MNLWFAIFVTATIASLLKLLFSFNSKPNSKNWPPGPQNIPIITIIIWLRRSFAESQAALRSLTSKFGPIVTLSWSSSRPVIFVFSRSLAYQALVHKAAIFADRPKPLPIAKILTSNQHTITFASYGPLWRLLRRNMTSMILHPSRVKDFHLARKWVLDILIDSLKGSKSESDSGVVKVVDHFRFAMFHLLVVMCFGDKMEESKVKEIEATLQELLASLFSRFRVLNFKWVWLTRILFRNRWNEFYTLKKKQEDVLLTCIRARKQQQQNAATADDSCYLDTLLSLEIPSAGEARKLTEEELVSLCFEFLNAGTDTTSTALQWTMANLVKYPKIQAKVYNEIKQVIGEEAEEVSEDELSKMPYLKAVVLEGLRRHPPGHFVLPHGVTEEVELGGYTIPQNAALNFAVAEIGWDAEVWEDPMEFKPERFMDMIKNRDEIDHEEVGIKMMPFGAGRRMCPGHGLAMLHLEYFVANLIWKFEWKVDGNEVDLSEKQEFTIVMKYPLNACISPRKIK
ncbi:Cytochrome P450 89A9 [Bienertia sinuspersici]